MIELLLFGWLAQSLPQVTDPLPSVEDVDETPCPIEQAAIAAALKEAGAANTPVAPASALRLTAPGTVKEEGSLDQQIAALLREHCADCHDRGDALPLIGDLSVVRTGKGVSGMSFITPGKPDQSYLMWKVMPSGNALIEGDTMPPDEELSNEHIQLIRRWIAKSVAAPGNMPAPLPVQIPEELEFATPEDLPAFVGTYGPTGPTTTTYGKRTLTMDIRHRFGTMLAKGNYLGLRSGVVVSVGLGYGIADWLDVLTRFSTLGGDFEIGAKVVPARQEAGAPLSAGVFLSYDGMVDKSVARRATFNAMGLVSRVWGRRWAWGFLLGYSTNTNHNPDPVAVIGPKEFRIVDRRGSAYMGLQSAFYLDRRQRHSFDVEWLFPWKLEGNPDSLHFHGDDTSRGLVPMGALSLGWSGRVGKHVFQVFISNNRAIHTNWWASGPEVTKFKDSLLLGFNISRAWRFR